MKRNEIAEMVADRILAENILSKEKLVSSLEPMITVLINQSRKVNVPKSEEKIQEKFERMQQAINKQSERDAFTLKELRGVYNEEQMKDFFSRRDENERIKGYR